MISLFLFSIVVTEFCDPKNINLTLDTKNADFKENQMITYQMNFISKSKCTTIPNLQIVMGNNQVLFQFQLVDIYIAKFIEQKTIRYFKSYVYSSVFQNKFEASKKLLKFKIFSRNKVNIKVHYNSFFKPLSFKKSYKIITFGNVSVKTDKRDNSTINYGEIASKGYDFLVLFGNFGKFNIHYGYEEILDKIQPILVATPIFVVPAPYDQIDNG